ncbi:hypothetical protein EUBVEN_00578 [Eubacterium ventriosum ATCC 27560]|uniref:Uncharacterized protein n=1 Tax=Eubacterium ventriosum ATCC 27560 TaxID=411463 RepID=A5Z4F2_9FIRM|nr:hypothetical protein EUBVEN_00578 [Eubacterium ventriosum ATCC 27560]
MARYLFFMVSKSLSLLFISSIRLPVISLSPVLIPYSSTNTISSSDIPSSLFLIHSAISLIDNISASYPCRPFSSSAISIISFILSAGTLLFMMSSN